MSRKRTFIALGAICLILALAASAAAPAIAQTGTGSDVASPLLEMLARVPDTPEARATSVDYIDYHALIAARPDAIQPKDVDEWEQVAESTTREARLTRAAIFGIYTGPEGFIHYFGQLQGIKLTTGIDFFSIERAVRFGEPPRQGTLYNGTFDPAAIETAFTAIGFTAQQTEDGTLICSPQGCDDGLRINPQERDITNPFGGHLGRREPLLATSDYLYNSPDFAVVEAMIAAQKESTPSLADSPDFQAMAKAIGERGMLIQAIFPDVRYLVAQVNGFDPRASAERAQSQIATARAQFTPFARYSAVGIAHVYDSQQQQALILLVFENASDAAQAGQIITARLETAESFLMRRSWKQMIEDRGGTVGEPVVVEEAGRAVLVLPLPFPLDRDEPNGLPNGGFRVSGLLFRVFAEAYVRRDLPWLAAEFPAE